MNKHKEIIYLETSCISAYFDFKKQDHERKKITRVFWSQVGPKYNIVISNIVFAELENTKVQKFRNDFLDFIEHIKLIEGSRSFYALNKGLIGSSPYEGEVRRGL